MMNKFGAKSQLDWGLATFFITLKGEIYTSPSFLINHSTIQSLVHYARLCLHIKCTNVQPYNRSTAQSLNRQCHCSTGLTANVVGRIPALQRELVPVGRSQAKDRSRVEAYPYLLPLSSHEAISQNRKTLPRPLSVRLGTWSKWMGKDEYACKKPVCHPSPSRMRRKGKERGGRSADELDPTIYTVLCGGRSIAISYPCCQQATRHREPRSTASHTPPRPPQAEDANGRSH